MKFEFVGMFKLHNSGKLANERAKGSGKKAKVRPRKKLVWSLNKFQLRTRAKKSPAVLFLANFSTFTVFIASAADFSRLQMSFTCGKKRRFRPVNKELSLGRCKRISVCCGNEKFCENPNWAQSFSSSQWSEEKK